VDVLVQDALRITLKGDLAGESSIPYDRQGILVGSTIYIPAFRLLG
jgi:hypothetical protein